jgi:hypothetical protein
MEPLGYISPAEFEKMYYEQEERSSLVAELKSDGLQNSRDDSVQGDKDEIKKGSSTYRDSDARTRLRTYLFFQSR